MQPLSSTHASSVLPAVMVHTVSPFLVNSILVYVVTHVKVKSSPTVALSDDVVSIKPETNRRFYFIIIFNNIFLQITLLINIVNLN